MAIALFSIKKPLLRRAETGEFSFECSHEIIKALLPALCWWIWYSL